MQHSSWAKPTSCVELGERRRFGEWLPEAAGGLGGTLEKGQICGRRHPNPRKVRHQFDISFGKVPLWSLGVVRNLQDMFVGFLVCGWCAIYIACVSL